jgi:hypothetical protein
VTRPKTRCGTTSEAQSPADQVRGSLTPRRATARITASITVRAPKLPKLLGRYGVGPDTAASLLIAAGDNPDRMSSEDPRLRGAARQRGEDPSRSHPLPQTLRRTRDLPDDRPAQKHSGASTNCCLTSIGASSGPTSSTAPSPSSSPRSGSGFVHDPPGRNLAVRRAKTSGAAPLCAITVLPNQVVQSRTCRCTPCETSRELICRASRMCAALLFAADFSLKPVYFCAQ